LASIIFELQVCASDLLPWQCFSLRSNLAIGILSVVQPPSRLTSMALAKLRFSLCALES
jgi:hypothetical protein